MLDIQIIRDNPKELKAAIKKRGIDVDFGAAVKLDKEKREVQTELENLRAEKNRASKEIGKVPAGERPALIAATNKIGGKIADLEAKFAKLDEELFEFLSALPNVPLPEVQAGDKEQNKVIKTFGQKPKFDFTPKAHVELCTALGLIDYERAARMSGSGSWVYTGMGARLEWALLNYFIDYHLSNGFTFIMPPHLLNYESGYAAGQFPKFKDDVFAVEDKFLLPTAETALINMHRGEIIPKEKLPIKYVGYSPCYRREAGSYRASERGMIRGHQFNKIEMFVYCLPEESPRFFTELVSHAEKLVEGLGLHYQTVALAAGDVSASMQKTYDIEVYIPSMGGYKEVSSASTAGDYQARRANIRTKAADGTRYVHTLNASGLATSRIVPAIVEQFQTADGHVRVPSVLQKYLGGVTII